MFTSATREKTFSNFFNVFSSSSFVAIKKNIVEIINEFINWEINENLKLKNFEKREIFLQIDRILNNNDFDFQII